jgi:hypothetical protein
MVDRLLGVGMIRPFGPELLAPKWADNALSLFEKRLRRPS